MKTDFNELYTIFSKILTEKYNNEIGRKSETEGLLRLGIGTIWDIFHVRGNTCVFK